MKSYISFLKFGTEVGQNSGRKFEKLEKNTFFRHEDESARFFKPKREQTRQNFPSNKKKPQVDPTFRFRVMLRLKSGQRNFLSHPENLPFRLHYII